VDRDENAASLEEGGGKKRETQSECYRKKLEGFKDPTETAKKKQPERAKHEALLQKGVSYRKEKKTGEEAKGGKKRTGPRGPWEKKTKNAGDRSGTDRGLRE